jgi:hypothetical protein
MKKGLQKKNAPGDVGIILDGPPQVLIESLKKDDVNIFKRKFDENDDRPNEDLRNKKKKFTDDDLEMKKIRLSVLNDCKKEEAMRSSKIKVFSKERAALNKSDPRRKELTFKIKKLRSEIEDFRESMNNQVFFHHPDSIIALRHLNTKNSGTFQFEAITARIFFEGEDIEEDDGGKSSFDYKNYKCTAVPLSKNWALLNFDKDFIEKVMAHENSHDFIYVRDLQKNVTKESFDAGKLQEKMFKNFRRKKEYSGESGDKLIVKLKAKFTFSGRSVKAEKQSWFLKSVSKSHFVSRSRTRAQYSDC